MNSPISGLTVVLCGITLVAAALKLLGGLTASWWWVTAPIWGGYLLFFAWLGILFAHNFKDYDRK